MNKHLQTAKRKFLLSVTITVMAFCLGIVSCKKDDHGHSSHNDTRVIYLESNDYHDGMNSILAYRDSGNGKLSPLAGSPFMTAGAGIGNPTQALGPDDSDTPLIVSADGHYLYAVNPGSNTIAVFNIQDDGSLTPISGSPFPSGGETPVSVALRGHQLFVVNKSGDPLHPSTVAPNYAVFSVKNNGGIEFLSKFETSPGTSPAQALVSNNGKYLFGADFLGFMLDPMVGTLRSFEIGASDLTAVDTTPYHIPGKGGALGLWQHPSNNTLYVGFPLQGKVGVYTIDDATGGLTFHSAVDAGPAACWLRTNSTGKNLYALNSGENTISIYNTSDAENPVPLDKLTLKQSGPTYTVMGMPFTTSEDFSLGFSKSEKYLYVVSQYTNPDFTVGHYNLLHVLAVADDGKLTEPSEPIEIPVASDIRPQGIAVN